MEKNDIGVRNIINPNEEIIEIIEQREDISLEGRIIELRFYIREM